MPDREKNNRITLSLVVPCYNEAGNVARFQEEALRVIGGGGLDFEIVFVDDGSRDDTLRNLRALWEKKACPVQVISFSRNFGKEAAMLAGLEAAGGEFITLVDGDLQQPLETVLEMVEILRTKPEYDCVAAYQENRKESGPSKVLKGAFYRVINRLSDVEFVENASDFRTMRRPVAESLLRLTEYHRFSKGLFSWVGFSTCYIPYTARARFDGKTKWSTGKLFRYAWDGILSFSTAPIKLAIYLGILFASLSFVYLIVVFIQKAINSIEIPGYATIVYLILLLGGLQLIFLGVIGEYVGRIYVQSKQRPSYLVKERLGWDGEGALSAPAQSEEAHE